MKDKIWKERRLYFKADNSVIIQPTEELDGIVLQSRADTDKKDFFRLYLSYNEAKELGKQLIDYANESDN